MGPEADLHCGSTAFCAAGHCSQTPVLLFRLASQLHASLICCECPCRGVACTGFSLSLLQASAYASSCQCQSCRSQMLTSTMQDMVRQQPQQQPGRVLVGAMPDAKPRSMRLMQESGNTGASTPLHVHSETH